MEQGAEAGGGRVGVGGVAGRRRRAGCSRHPRRVATATGAASIVANAVSAFGRLDVLFNNAIFRGVGTLDRITDLTVESMTNLLAGNFMHQILLIQQVIPHMLAAGGGTIIDMVSGSARLDPAGPPGEGGWGILYSASKAAVGRVAGGVNAEYRAQGIKAFNVDPGNVVTEARKAAKPDDEYSSGYGSEPAEATGKVVAWLATDPTADKFLGKWIFAPKLCSDLGLLPGWTFQAPQ